MLGQYQILPPDILAVPWSGATETLNNDSGSPSGSVSSSRTVTLTHVSSFVVSESSTAVGGVLHGTVKVTVALSVPPFPSEIL